jgi:hypothetical protein
MHSEHADTRGLCPSCIHVKLVRSQKEVEYLLCGLARTDSRFVRYPSLPVLHCAGHELDEDLEP